MESNKSFFEESKIQENNLDLNNQNFNLEINKESFNSPTISNLI